MRPLTLLIWIVAGPVLLLLSVMLFAAIVSNHTNDNGEDITRMLVDKAKSGE